MFFITPEVAEAIREANAKDYTKPNRYYLVCPKCDYETFVQDDEAYLCRPCFDEGEHIDLVAGLGND